MCNVTHSVTKWVLVQRVPVSELGPLLYYCPMNHAHDFDTTWTFNSMSGPQIDLLET